MWETRKMDIDEDSYLQRLPSLVLDQIADIIKHLETRRVNVIALGHVDCGKSSLVANLLYLTGNFDERLVQKLKEQQKMWRHIWSATELLTQLRDEQERGITIDTHLYDLKTNLNKYKITLIDSPGHKDFIKNTICGISQSDAAILVVAAPPGEFEAGFCRDGQTKEFALLAYAFGISRGSLVVCINKMDARLVDWSEGRFNEIVTSVSNHLSKVGFDKKKISFIPISAWLGDNVVERSPKAKWYTGPTVLQALTQIQPSGGPSYKLLRISIRKCNKIGGIGIVPVGRVLSGVLRSGMKVKFAPSGITAEVNTIESFFQPADSAVPGDIIGFRIKGQGFTAQSIKRGFIVGSSDPRVSPSEVESFTAKIIIVSPDSSFKAGYNASLHCHTAAVGCRIEAILRVFDKKTGKEVQESIPEKINNTRGYLVKIVPINSLCVERFSDNPRLGRFVLRDHKKTIAAGIVHEVNQRL